MADSGRLDELKRKFDENPQRYFAPLANEYRKAGDTDRAIELCRTYLPQQPSHMSGYIVYGQALFDAGRGEEAAAVFKQALTLDPENVIALRYLGDVARADGDSAGAMRWYGKVLELDPRNEEMANQITALASPSARKAPRHERVAPPTVRPEPEYDASAVALAQLVSEPDRPQPEIARAAAAPQEAEPERETEQGDQRGADGENERAPMLVLEESFEIISWPSEPIAHEPTAHEPTAHEPMAHEPAPQTEAEANHSISAAAAEPVMDQSSELAPAADRFFDMTSVETGGHVEGEDEDDEDADGSVTESPFVTETMAELYVQQGLAEDALLIYRQLVLRRSDPRLHQRIAELERGGSGDESTPMAEREEEQEREPEREQATAAADVAVPDTAEAAAPTQSRETVREFFARIGVVEAQSHPHIAAENEGGLSAIFGSDSGDAADLSAAQSLAGAFGARQRAAATPRD